MLRRKAALTLLIGLLSVIGLSASDQDCSCTPKTKTHDCGCAPEKKTPDCACAPKKETQDCCPVQKPCAVYTPTRTIAPRDLPPVYESQARLAAEAAEVLEDFPHKGWLENASAIAVIASVKKAAFGFGFRWGTGLISMRDENGCWIPPSYIHIHGGNFGFQAGVQATDLVLIFTNSGAVRSLLRGKLTLNADASAAALKWGRKGLVGFLFSCPTPESIPSHVQSGYSRAFLWTAPRSRSTTQAITLSMESASPAPTSLGIGA